MEIHSLLPTHKQLSRSRKRIKKNLKQVTARTLRLVGLNSQGFTLIEMLIAVGIMLILVGGGIAAFITFNDKQRLQSSSKLLQTYLRTAQAKARLGDRPAACTKLLGYSVRMQPTGGVVEMVALCEPTEVTVQTFNLDGIEAAQVDGQPMNIEFQVLHGGVQNFGTVSLVSSAGYQQNFVVSQGGEIGGTPNITSGVSFTPAASTTPSFTPINVSFTPSSSFSPNLFPSSSPFSSPNFTNVSVNAATGLSCSQVCINQGYVGCNSVGTDGFGTNGLMSNKNLLVCGTASATCTTPMEDLGGTCDGNIPQWTRCNCYSLNDNIF